MCRKGAQSDETQGIQRCTWGIPQQPGYPGRPQPHRTHNLPHLRGALPAAGTTIHAQRFMSPGWKQRPHKPIVTGMHVFDHAGTRHWQGHPSGWIPKGTLDFPATSEKYPTATQPRKKPRFIKSRRWPTNKGVERDFQSTKLWTNLTCLWPMVAVHDDTYLWPYYRVKFLSAFDTSRCS